LLWPVSAGEHRGISSLTREVAAVAISRLASSQRSKEFARDWHPLRHWPSTNRALRALGVLAAVVATSLIAATGVAWATPQDGGTGSNDTPAPCAPGIVDCPTGDPFYAPPPDLAALANGTVVGVRSATIAQPGPTVKAAFTVSYRSEDSFGAPVLDTETLLMPITSYLGKGSTPLVSVPVAEDSLGAQCEPSYDLTHGGTNAVTTVEESEIEALLGQGYVVVAPDYEGAAEQFLAGPQAAHAVLDGIRAAESVAAGLSRPTRVAIDGYSGGAFATGWASELAGSYAPDLNIAGAAEGGTPANLESVLQST
jgi:hypothetical protein